MNMALLFQSAVLCLACSEFMHSVLAGPSYFYRVLRTDTLLFLTKDSERVPTCTKGAGHLKTGLLLVVCAECTQV